MSLGLALKEMDGWMYRQMDRWMDGYTDGMCVCIWMDVGWIDMFVQLRSILIY